MPALYEERIAQGLLGTGITTLYTVPAATSVITRNIAITNFTATTASAELWAGAGSEITQRFLPGVEVEASGVLNIDNIIILNPTDVLYGKASTASALNYHIYGARIT